MRLNEFLASATGVCPQHVSFGKTSRAVMLAYEKLAPAFKNGPRQVLQFFVISNKLLSFCEFLLRVDLLIDRPRYRRLFITPTVCCHEFQ